MRCTFSFRLTRGSLVAKRSGVFRVLSQGLTGTPKVTRDPLERDLMDHDLLTMLEETKNFNASGNGSVVASPPLSTGTTHVAHDGRDGTPVRSATLISTPDATSRSHWGESVERKGSREHQEYQDPETRDPRSIPYQPDTYIDDPVPLDVHPSRLSVIDGTNVRHHRQSFEQRDHHNNGPRQPNPTVHGESSPWNPERTPHRAGWKARGYHDRNEQSRWGGRDGRRFNLRYPLPSELPPQSTYLRRRSHDANNRDDGSNPQRRRRKRTVTVSESSSSSSSSSGCSSLSEDGSSSEAERQVREENRRKVRRESDHRNGRRVRGQRLPSGDGAQEMEVQQDPQPHVPMTDGFQCSKLEGKEGDVTGEGKKRRRSSEYENRNGRGRPIRDHESHLRYDRRSVETSRSNNRAGGSNGYEMSGRKHCGTEPNYFGRRQFDEQHEPRSQTTVVESSDGARAPAIRFVAPAGGVGLNDNQAMNQREETRATTRVRLRGRWDTPSNNQNSQPLDSSRDNAVNGATSKRKLAELGRKGVDVFLGEDEDELRTFYRLIPPPPPMQSN
ncbi:hypothetical protein BJ742DRAFT_767354 [Cladochytrium replicatum]|nr:hypothetical protein BJ742DRAFT_767354 [Cladochytrium replicatum]